MTIPVARYKTGREHTIPLSEMAAGIIASLPRWASGRYLFSADGGVRPIAGWFYAKQRLDKISGVKDWVIHDLRRTMRTRLSELRVPEHVAELALGHARRGMPGVYDQYEYFDQIAEAMEAWAARLRLILDPEANVVRPSRFAL